MVALGVSVGELEARHAVKIVVIFGVDIRDYYHFPRFRLSVYEVEQLHLVRSEQVVNPESHRVGQHAGVGVKLSCLFYVVVLHVHTDVGGRELEIWRNLMSAGAIDYLLAAINILKNFIQRDPIYMKCPE